MKIPYLIICLLVALSMNNSSSKDSTQTIKMDDKCYHWSDSNAINTIVKFNDSTYYYLGETNVKGNDKVFYLSKCESLDITNNRISFVLNDFILSKTPFSKNDIDKAISDESITLPIELIGSVSFQGIMTNEKLVLQKTSLIYDSYAEKIVFYCMEYKQKMMKWSELYSV